MTARFVRELRQTIRPEFGEGDFLLAQINSSLENGELMRYFLLTSAFALSVCADAITITQNLSDIHAEYSGSLDQSPGGGIFLESYLQTTTQQPEVHYEGNDWTGDFTAGTKILSGSHFSGFYRDGLSAMGFNVGGRNLGSYTFELSVEEVVPNNDSLRKSASIEISGANRGSEDGNTTFVGAIGDYGYVIQYFNFALETGSQTGIIDFNNQLGVGMAYQRIGAVPEPTSFAALGLGLLGLASGRWRRR